MDHSVALSSKSASSDPAIASPSALLAPSEGPTRRGSSTDTSEADFSSELRHHQTSQKEENRNASGLWPSARASKPTEDRSADPAKDGNTVELTSEGPSAALRLSELRGHRGQPVGGEARSLAPVPPSDPATELCSTPPLAATESNDEGGELGGESVDSGSDAHSSAAEDLLRILSLGQITSTATLPMSLPLLVSAPPPALGAALSSAEVERQQGSSSFALPETSRVSDSADLALSPEIFGQGLPSVSQGLSVLPSVAAAVGSADRNVEAAGPAAAWEMQSSMIAGLSALSEGPLVNPEGNAEPAAALSGLAAEAMGGEFASKAQDRSGSRLVETFETVLPEVGTPEAAMRAGGTSTARSVESMPQKFDVTADTDLNPSLLNGGAALGHSLVEGAQTAAGTFEGFDSQNERRAQGEDRASGVLSSLNPPFETRVATALEVEPESLILSPLGLQPGAALRQEILSRVMEVRSQGSGSMNVVLRPDAGTQLNVQLRSHRGEVEVMVVMERGESGPLRAAWEGLQQSLAQQGVRLSDLDAAKGATRDATAQQISQLAGPELDRLKVLDSGTSGFGGSDTGSNSNRHSRSPAQDPFLPNEQGNNAGRDHSRAQDPSNPQLRTSLGMTSSQAGSPRAGSSVAGVTLRSLTANHLETWA